LTWVARPSFIDLGGQAPNPCKGTAALCGVHFGRPQPGAVSPVLQGHSNASCQLCESHHGTPGAFAGFRVQADRGKARAGETACADVAHRPCLELQMLPRTSVVFAPAAGLGSLWDAPCERSLASCGRTQVAVVARPHTASIHVNPWPDPTTQDHPPEYLSPSHWQGLFWRWMGWLVGR
jgi:hypothetical protein